MKNSLIKSLPSCKRMFQLKRLSPIVWTVRLSELQSTSLKWVGKLLNFSNCLSPVKLVEQVLGSGLVLSVFSDSLWSCRQLSIPTGRWRCLRGILIIENLFPAHVAQRVSLIACVWSGFDFTPKLLVIFGKTVKIQRHKSMLYGVTVVPHRGRDIFNAFCRAWVRIAPSFDLAGISLYFHIWSDIANKYAPIASGVLGFLLCSIEGDVLFWLWE